MFEILLNISSSLFIELLDDLRILGAPSSIHEEVEKYPSNCSNLIPVKICGFSVELKLPERGRIFRLLLGLWLGLFFFDD